MSIIENEVINAETTTEEKIIVTYNDGTVGFYDPDPADMFVDAPHITNSLFRWDSERIESIKIPQGVTVIGAEAFKHCSSLIEIEIPDSVTEIGVEAFCDCFALTSIKIPNSVTKIREMAFLGCRSLTDITLPESVAEIWWRAFFGCRNLKKVVFLGKPTFYRLEDFGCKQQTSGRNVFESESPITFWGPEALKNIGRDVDIFNAVQFKWEIEEGEAVITGFHSIVGEGISIPPNIDGMPVTKIAGDAFLGQRRCPKIDLPDTIREISDGSFYDCSSLTSIHIPERVKKIGRCAFKKCSSLTSINIPDTVQEIGEEAFNGCSSLTEIKIPDGIKEIPPCLFSDCSSLKKVEISESVTKIGYGAFAHCSSLTEIKVPDCVTAIQSFAFCGCSSLTEFNLPSRLTFLGVNAFCENAIDTLIVPKTLKEVQGEAFSGIKRVYHLETTHVKMHNDNCCAISQGCEKFPKIYETEPRGRDEIVGNFDGFLQELADESRRLGLATTNLIGEKVYTFPISFEVEGKEIRVKSGSTSPGKVLMMSIKAINKKRLENGEETPFYPFKSEQDQLADLFKELVENEYYSTECDLVIDDDFEFIYSSINQDGDFGSCMNDKGYHTFFNNSVKAKAASIQDNDGYILARCIVWQEAKTKDGRVFRLADRQYASDDRMKATLIKKLLEANEIDLYKSYNASCHSPASFRNPDGTWASEKEFEIECNLKNDGVVSYMDTFKWYIPSLKKAYNYNPIIVYRLDTTSGRPCCD